MYSSKKEVDNHVRIALSKIRSEKDRSLRGLTIAKLYFKIKEYATAEQYICSYLSVKDDNDQAHKMLGQCYQFLKQPKKALQSFQRSLQLNPKQPELLAEVCQLLVEDDQLNANKAKYWCELAESAKVESESVYALRMKLMNQSNVTSNEIENILRKEISNRPSDVNPRVRLVRHFLDQQQVVDAFKYVHEFELQQNEAFNNSSEWYNILWLVLSKYEQLPDTKKDWEFWLLVAMCLERLVFLSFLSTETSGGNAVTETANLLFRLDQYLFKITQLSEKFHAQRELVALFLTHYRSQLVLHAVALIFKRELMQKKNKWRETLQLAFPLLLLAYQAEPKENKEPWMKHCDENGAKLIQLWHREGAFRCSQAGRILLSCISEENKENSKREVNSVFGSQPGALWSSSDELLAQIRQTCVDKQWRRNVFVHLFCNSDQKLKEQTSLLVKCAAFAEPIYELPSVATIEDFEEKSQYLRPQSLRHMVYLHLSYGDLSQVRAKFFNGLNFSTSNLSFCGGESLNQLDVDSYLYAAIIETQRTLQMNREMSECYSSQGNMSAIFRPRILPFVNMQEDLCNDEQSNWWSLAYKVYKNLAKTDNAAQMRADLQTGIEVVRGINGPKMDMLIVFKLGKIFSLRAQNVRKPVERSFLEARVESLYLHGLKMLKLHNRGVLEPFRKTFKYKANSAAIERELNEVAEYAVLYLSERMLKKAQYEELIEEMNGIPLPFATYKQAEAYRKMEEASSTSKTAKQRYAERAAECMQQTLTLLKNTKFDTNHPLNTTIHTELKRFQNKAKKFSEENGEDYSFLAETTTAGGLNNSSTYEDAQTEFFSPQLNRSTHRDVMATMLAAVNASPQAAAQNSEIESLVKQMASTLTFVKEELVCAIKPEVVSMRQEIISLKDKVSQLEDSMKKLRASSSPPSRDDGSNVLDDLYIIEDALQNQLYPQQSQQSTQMFPNAPGNSTGSFGGAVQTTNPQPPNQQRLNTPSALQMQQQAAAAAVAAYNSPMFNPNYPMNYYAPPYMLTQQNSASNPLLAQRGPMGLPYMDNGPNMNFNMPPAASLFPPTPTAQAQQSQILADGRTNNMFSLLNPTQPPPPVLPLPQPTLPNLPLPSLSSMSLVQPTVTSPLMPTAPSNVTFNKALNNQPVEKGPPANVVITSSDPLPNPKSAIQLQQQQPTLSVTIPSHHIKPSLVQAPEITPSFSNFPQQPMMPTSQANIFGNSSFGVGNTSFTFGGTTNTFPGTKDATSNFINNFSFKPAVEQALAANISASNSLNDAEKSSNTSAPLNESTLNELNKSLDIESAEYDPRPDFQPIIPLPDEIEVRTGEEDEEVMFCEHAKLYRFVDKEWKERGIGTLKILKNKDNNSRILMRRDQTHKICANHKITKDLKLNPKTEKNGHTWAAPDFADGEVKSEIFFVRFKYQELAQKFFDAFKQAQKEDEGMNVHQAKEDKKEKTTTTTAHAPFGLSKSTVTTFATSTPTGKTETKANVTSIAPKVNAEPQKPTPAVSTANKPLFTGLNLTTTTSNASSATTTTTPNPFANFSFSTISAATTTTPAFSGLTTSTSTAPTPFSGNIFGKPADSTATPFSVANLQLSSLGSQSSASGTPPKGSDTSSTLVSTNNLNKSSTSDTEDEYVPTAQFKPVIPLPELVEVTTGEENYKQLFEYRAKLLRFDKDTREWKERGIGNVRVLQHKDDKDDVRLVMRREQIHKLCCNQRVYKDTEFKYAKNSKTAIQWIGHDYSEGELSTESLTLRFKTQDICKEFYETITKAQSEMSKKVIMQTDGQGDKPCEADSTTKPNKTPVEKKGFGDAFKPKAGSWTCDGCYIVNPADKLYCVSCETPKDDTVPKKEASKPLFTATSTVPFTFGFANAGQTNATTAQTIFGAPSSVSSGFTFGTQLKTTSSITNITSPAATTIAPISTSTASTTSDFGDKFKPKPGSWNCQDCYTNNAADKVYCIACEAPKDSSIPKKESSAAANNKDILALSDPTQKFSFGFPTATATVTSQPAPTISQPIFGTSAASALPTLAKPTFSFNLQSKAMTAPTAPTDAGVPFSAPFSLNKKDFTFTMNTKNSETDSTKTGGADADVTDPDDSSHLHEEEENNTYFAPVIPLPDKIEVKTGEEDEDVLYQHRAKLYRFVDAEWKERGIGDVKILRHKTTKKLRVVMRRDQIHKICLNHVLNDDVEYKPKDEKSWLFVVNDYSEGEVQLEKLSLRFKTKEIAEDFMNAVKSALTNIEKEVKPKEQNGHVNEKSNNVVSQPKLTPMKKTEIEEKKNSDNTKDEPKWPLVQPDLKLPNASTISLANRPFTLKQSALVTPTKAEEAKPADDAAGKNAPVSFSFKTALKENEDAKTKAPASGGFLFGSGDAGSGAPKFGSSIFGGGIGTQTVFGQTPSIFGNLNAAKPKDAGQNDAPPPATGTESKFIFGEKLGNAAPMTKSIFGGGLSTEPKSTLFGTTNDVTSIFNAGKIGNNSTSATTANQQSIFSGSNTNKATTSGSIFDGATTFSNLTSTNKNGSLFGSTIATTDSTNNNADATKPFNFADLTAKSGGLDFASLAATSNNNNKTAAKPGPGGFIGLTNQDAFSSFLKPINKNGNKEHSNANDADGDDGGDAGNDENYDPHYDPIIPLPKEIVLSTGEEDEEKVYSERAMLFRFDADSKEWKERGVGEIKLLKHTKSGRYRLLLRREQIHKLVLNFPITEDFKFNTMKNNIKSFLFVGMNFAESSKGDYEKLAVRFKKPEIAAAFSQCLNNCIEEVLQKAKADAE